eukprot:1106618-Pleurochrysis_carterae.AAC.1
MQGPTQIKAALSNSIFRLVRSGLLTSFGGLAGSRLRASATSDSSSVIIVLVRSQRSGRVCQRSAVSGKTSMHHDHRTT